jgi:hypothetical protein
MARVGGTCPQTGNAGQWGLHAFENPMLPAAAARPVWRADRHPLVLAAVAEPARNDADAFLLGPVRGLAKIVRSEDRERLLLSDGLRSVRLDVAGASMTEGPVQLRFEIPGPGCAALLRILALRRFLHLAATGNFSRMLHPPEARARRLVLLLRTFDGLEAGASQREIAAELLGRSAGAADWRIEDSSIRSQAQRLVRGARRMAAGAWLGLLQ